jgi:hypothetical protein
MSKEKILPQYKIELDLNSTGIPDGGAVNSLIVEQTLNKYFIEVERAHDNTLIAAGVKPKVNSSTKLLIVKVLAAFSRSKINKFDLSTERLIKDFNKIKKDNEYAVRLVVADDITPVMKKYCELRNIEVIYFNRRDQKYKLIWKKKR